MIYTTESTMDDIPIGTIVAFHIALGSEFISSDYMACDGSTVTKTDSPLYGETVPDLNSGNVYLRGSDTAGVTSGSNAPHTHTLPTWPVGCDNQVGPYPLVYVSGLVQGNANGEPPYINIKWYMKVL